MEFADVWVKREGWRNLWRLLSIAIAKIHFRIKIDRRKRRRWIESLAVKSSENVTKFHPLPEGEGRGEGKRGVNYQKPSGSSVPIRESILAINYRTIL